MEGGEETEIGGKRVLTGIMFGVFMLLAVFNSFPLSYGVRGRGISQ